MSSQSAAPASWSPCSSSFALARTRRSTSEACLRATTAIRSAGPVPRSLNVDTKGITHRERRDAASGARSDCDCVRASAGRAVVSELRSDSPGKAASGCPSSLACALQGSFDVEMPSRPASYLRAFTTRTSATCLDGFEPSGHALGSGSNRTVPSLFAFLVRKASLQVGEALRATIV